MIHQQQPNNDGLIVTTTNPATGETWTRHLNRDEYAVLHGPDLVVAERGVPLRGGVRIVLLPRSRWGSGR